MIPRRQALLLLAAGPALAQSHAPKDHVPDEPLDYAALAAQIVKSVAPAKGVRVLNRVDPEYLAALAPQVEAKCKAAGAIVTTRPYAASAPNASERAAFDALLAQTEIYLWMPVAERKHKLWPSEEEAINAWLARGGRRRQIHFHWEPPLTNDGLRLEPVPPFFARYQKAVLELNYPELSRTQKYLVESLSAGPIRLTTPEGTELTFRTGDRAFNLQDGDAGEDRLRSAKLKVDREIELPAGVVRVAPVESTVDGTLVIPSARFNGQAVRAVQMRFVQGRAVRIFAELGQKAIVSDLMRGGAEAFRFREFCVGCNPLLVSENPVEVDYYGYGAGVVRVSIGGNSELGGEVPGNFVRWFFLTNATVTVGGVDLVRDGKLRQGRFREPALSTLPAVP